MNLGTSEHYKGKNDLPSQYRFITPENLQSQINALGKKYRNSAEVLWSNVDLTGQVCKCHVLGINYLTGDLFYKNSDGNWELFLAGTTGGGGGSFDATVDFSVNTNPNTVGTTFSPNTPQLTTVLYVSTIDFSQWTWNGSAYVTYISPFWTTSGNPSVSSSNFIGSINNQALKFRTNNTERMQISAAGNVGIGVAPTTDKLEVVGNSKFSGVIKNTSGISISGSGIFPSNGASIDIENNTSIVRIATTTNPTSGGRAILTFDYGTTPTVDPGWRLGMNPSLGNTQNFEIEELTAGTHTNKFIIQKGTGFVRIGGSNSENTIQPTQQLDVLGNIKFSGVLMPNNLAGTTGQVLTSQGGSTPPIWTTPSGGGSSINFADEEVPSGLLNSLNSTFVLSHTPVSGSIKVYLRGLRLKNGDDYTISGNVITMIIIPDSGDNFVVDYRY